MAAVTGAPAARAQHAGDMLIGATGAGSGALALDHDVTRRVQVFESASGGGNTLHSTTDPGWDLLSTPAGGLLPLAAGTPVSVSITAVDPGVSLRIGTATLNAAGQSRLLGTAPSIHVHPSWQLVLPTGVLAERTISFRMTTASAAYAPSIVYTAMLSNTTTTTTLATTTTNVATTSSTASTSTSTTVPPAGVELRSGKTLQLKDKPGAPEKRGMTVLSKDPALTLGSGNGSTDDPTLAGATVRIVGDAGAAFDVTYPMPAAHWTLVGKPGEHKGYKYKDAKLLAGPIKAATLRPAKQLELVGKGGALAHDLTLDPRPLDVVVTLGTRRYCLRFGGAIEFDPGKKWKAKDAPAPGACAP